MNNTLIDNSIEALSMTTTLRKCLAIDGIKTVSIATGYWDIPGLAILQENLRSFIEKEGTTLRLLIGKDPQKRASILSLAIHRTERNTTTKQRGIIRIPM